MIKVSLVVVLLMYVSGYCFGIYRAHSFKNGWVEVRSGEIEAYASLGVALVKIFMFVWLLFDYAGEI